MKKVFNNFMPLLRGNYISWAVVFLFAFTGSILAQSGGQPGQFLNYGAGARALGMGGAFYAVADDASAAYWNPSALVLIERREFSFMQATLFEQTSMNFITYVHPTATKGTWGFSMSQLNSTGFEKVSITVDPATDEIVNLKSLGSFTSSERIMNFAWGRKVSDTLSFGMSIKNYSRMLDTSKDSFNIIDVSMMNQFSKLYRLSIGINNVFSKAGGDTDDKIPLTFRIGQSLSLFKNSLVFGLDVTKPMDYSSTIRFGGEYWMMYWTAFRFGVIATPKIQEADFGIGIKYRDFTFDVAQGVHALGTSTRFSVSLKMGQSKRAVKDAEVRNIIRQALQYFKSGNFQRAVEKLKMALDSDPGNNEIRRMLTRLQSAIDFVPNATGSEEIPTLIRRGIIAYVDGKDLRTAVNVLRHAYNKDPKNDKLLALLNMIEKEAGVSEITRKPEGPEIFTLIDQKTYDARQAIYEGKYDVALKRAQDILDLEPNNETALEIMGSALYLMDQKEKARVIWEKVLEINPNNNMVKQFLGQS
jgi:tetratricopeptide (TPR) repeat protein